MKKAAHIKILKDLAQPFQQESHNFKTYPGIGFIGACTLIAYLEKGWRRKNRRRLWQYCGIGVRRINEANNAKVYDEKRPFRCQEKG
jgi:transposase